MTGWAVTPHWQRYLLTKDDKWLAAVGYPAIRECALFYTDFMQRRGDGPYHIFPSNQGEDGFTGNAKDYSDRRRGHAVRPLLPADGNPGQRSAER